MTDALGHTTSYAYDADNSPVATTYADGSADSTLYDPAGRTVSKNDTLGRSTEYGYDALGRLVKVTDALGQVTQYTYDETGARMSQQDANRHATSFTYDFLTNVEIGRSLPDGASERRIDDAAAQVLGRTDFAGRTTLYTYDPMGRVLTRTYPDASVVSFTYTPTGQRATTTDARGATSYAYDSRNRLVRLTYPDGRVLAYGYDAHGDRTSLTAKIGAQSLTTTTGYDAASRPSQVTDPLGRVFLLTHDADGNRTELQDPNTTSTAYTYDARNRLTNLSTVQTTAGSAPTMTQAYAYTLDLAGRRTNVAEGDGTTRVYAYDAIDRLTGETVTGALSYAKTFAYDPVGNRLTQTTTGAGAEIVAYSYDTRDRLNAENATNYTYDANGNMTSKSAEATYTWDFENRLTNVALNGGPTVVHVYDADGNRVQTSVTASGGTASTTNMLVDAVGCASCGGGLSQVIGDTDASGTITALYVRAGDELIEVMRPASGGTWTTRFVHPDGLGSVRVLSDETGTTIDARGYEAFGTKSVEAGSDPLTYGFAGEPFEGTSKLAYHRARWMDAKAGRFEGMDPAAYSPPRPFQPYLYANDEPTNATDPTGREFDLESISASVAIETINATLAVATPIAQAVTIVCTLEELTSDVGLDPFTNSPCHDRGVPLYHGSVNNAQAIRERHGLDPFNLPVYVSRDRAAAEDAIAHSKDTDPNNSGVFESDVPTLLFNLEFAPSEQPYRGFYPYLLNSTEIPLRSPIQVETFNTYMRP